MAQWGAAAKAKNGGGAMKQTSQRSLLFRQNVNRTEEENGLWLELNLNFTWYNRQAMAPGIVAVSAMS